MTPEQAELARKIRKALGDNDFIEVDVVTVNGRQVLRLGSFIVNEGPTRAILLGVDGEVDNHGVLV